MREMASDPSSDGNQTEAQERHSVLAELPHTRPQRASARRETARRRARAARGGAKAAEPKAPAAEPEAPAAGRAKQAPVKAKPKATRATRRTRVPKTPPTPPQGYEADPNLAGTPVSPPSGTEVVAALAELAGELAQNGISTGGRLLKSALSRLSGS